MTRELSRTEGWAEILMQNDPSAFEMDTRWF